MIRTFRGERVARGPGGLDVEAPADCGPYALYRRIQTDRGRIHDAVAEDRFSARRDFASSRIKLQDFEGLSVGGQRIALHARGRRLVRLVMALPEDPTGV